MAWNVAEIGFVSDTGKAYRAPIFDIECSEMHQGKGRMAYLAESLINCVQVKSNSGNGKFMMSHHWIQAPGHLQTIKADQAT